MLDWYLRLPFPLPPLAPFDPFPFPLDPLGDAVLNDIKRAAVLLARFPGCGLDKTPIAGKDRLEEDELPRAMGLVK